MPKVMYHRLIVGTLDNMQWEQQEAPENEHRFLSPELTDEQVSRYLTMPFFHAVEEGKKEDAPPAPPAPDIPPAQDETKLPENSTTTVDQANVPDSPKGGDAKIKKAAGAKPAKSQTPKRETPAERKARLAAESQEGAE